MLNIFMYRFIRIVRAALKTFVFHLIAEFKDYGSKADNKWNNFVVARVE